jgi:hypothetical protein
LLGVIVGVEGGVELVVDNRRVRWRCGVLQVAYAGCSR